MNDKRSQFSVMNDIMNVIVTFFQWIMMVKGHNQEIIHTKRSRFSVMNDIMNDKKGHNIVNDSLPHKPDGLAYLLLDVM